MTKAERRTARFNRRQLAVLDALLLELKQIRAILAAKDKAPVLTGTVTLSAPAAKPKAQGE